MTHSAPALSRQAEHWLSRFEAALQSLDTAGACALFNAEECF